MSEPTRICLTCGATDAHPTLLACIEFLKGRLDSTTIELTDALKREHAAVEASEQITLNDGWLRDRIDEAHRILCPERSGTWQQRAQQIIDAAKEVVDFRSRIRTEPR